ncbi:MAG: hypothetical protein KF897_04085 [Opitutaceae bacterium]|nr:hypothetical protein [Opitutaceae bacterium]
MTPAAKLMDLTIALDLDSEEMSAWLDRQTGQVVWVEREVMEAAESGENAPEAEGMPDMEKAQWMAANGIAAGDDRYLALPTKFDFHEYRYMERFIGTVKDAGQADELWRAIKGRGAFRFFKHTAERFGLLDDWFSYRDEAMNRFMLDWAEANGVTVDQSPGQAGAT